MKASRALLGFVGLALASGLVQAADKPASMKLCYENEDTYPWVMKSKPGLNIILLNAVEPKVGVKFEMLAQPWKRCQEELRSGAFDGMFAASFKPDRMELGVYPMTGGKADESRAMMMDGYTLFRLKGGNVQWDGKKLTVNGSVGAQPGYSIIDQLKSLGAKVDDGGRTADDNLRKLLAGRVEAVALQSLEGENSLRSNPEFADKIEKISPPLVDKPFFLMLSKQFVAKYGDFSKDLWSAMAQVRDSAEFKAKVSSFK